MKYGLEQVVDIPKTQRLLDHFCDVVGVSAALIDLEGRVLAKSRWQRICSDFFRQNEETLARCIESDTHLANMLQQGKAFSVYRCRNGLTDATAAVRIEGEHVANLFVGQFLLESPDVEQFRLAAARNGFEMEPFLAALAAVPIIPEERVPVILAFLTTFAEFIAAMGIDRLRQIETTHALRVSEERFRSLVETSTDLIWETDEGGLFTYVSPKAESLLGYTPEEVLGRAVFDFVPEEEVERLKGLFVESAGLRKPFGTFESVTRHKEGHCVVLETSGIPFFDGDGQLVGYRGIDRDITERKRGEEALRDSEARLRSVFRAAPVGIGMVIDRVFSQANDKLCEMTGYSHEELLGQNARMLYPSEEEYEYVGREKYRQIASYGTGSVETRWKRKDGAVIDVQLSSTPLDFHDLSKGVVFTALDITARKRAEENQRLLEAQVQHAQKLESLGVLAGGIAHDFNNLLMAILGNADLALQELPPLSPACECLNGVAQATRRAAELCKQLLAYSGKGKFQAVALNLSELVEEMVQMLSVSISKQAALRYDLSKELPSIEADGTQIRQIVMNLITNASDAIGERNGTIFVRTGCLQCDKASLRESYLNDDLPEGAYAYIEVEDTGSGMDAETQRKLFDPFFTTKFTGRGLGLSAVLGIVRGHRGAIKVHSEAGKGSTFRVLFPTIAQPAQPIRSDGARLSKWQGHGLLLLVDDEESVRTVGVKMLRRMGFDVITAADGQEALSAYAERAKEVRCVLLDLTMPRMNGEQTFRELRRMREDLPVILSSGYTEQEISERFAGRGPAGFIQKPYRSFALQQEIRRVLNE